MSFLVHESFSRFDPRTIISTNEAYTIMIKSESGDMLVTGERETARTLFAVVSLLCVMLLSFLLGMRVKKLRNNVFAKVNLTIILVFALYSLALSFIFCLTVIETGLGLRTHELCHSAAIMSAVFYTLNKFTIYMFLLERARIVREPFVPRYKDGLWLSFMFIICAGFGTIAILGYLTPVVELSSVDGRCRIGFPATVSLPLMCFDVSLNVLLTGVFIYLMKPVLSHHGVLSLRGLVGERTAHKLRSNFAKAERDTEAQHPSPQRPTINQNMKTMLCKCLIGGALVMLSTIGNMLQIFFTKGREQGWIFLMVCTVDVSWGVLIVNWLTTGTSQEERDCCSSNSQQPFNFYYQGTPVRSIARPLIPTPSPNSSFVEVCRPSTVHDPGRWLRVNE